MIRWRHAIAPVLFFVCAVALRAADPPMIESIRSKVFDVYQRISPRAYAELPVRGIDIDDESLSRLGQWPWPRVLVARLVDRLTKAGAAAIVFDSVFAEPDRTSPSALIANWPADSDLDTVRRALAGLPSHDDLLAAAIGRGNVVTGFALTDGKLSRKPARKAGLATAGDDPRPYLASYSGAVVNLPELEASARGNGAMNLVPEIDGIVRRVPLLVRLGDTIYPTIAAEGLRIAQGASTYVVRSSGASGEAAFGQRTGLVDVRIGNVIVPTDSHGRVWLRERPSNPKTVIPVWEVLADGFDVNRIAGRIAVIGTSAAGLLDIKTTALNPAIPGMMVQVQVIEQMLAGIHMTRPDWANGAELLILVVVGGVLTILFVWLKARWGAIIGLTVILLAIAASWIAFADHQLLFSPFYFTVAMVLTYMISALTSFEIAERERRRLRNAFGFYVSRDLVADLVRHPDQLALGGEIRDITVLFSDIRGFTSIAERLNAEELTSLVNRIFTPLSEVILSNRGTIDKFMGDSVMAFWNAPQRVPDHARAACVAALGFQARLDALNAELATQSTDEAPAPEVRMGVGISTGECCVGNFGSDERFDYSAIGDDVNLASRLEGQTKLYGVPIIASEGTRERAPGIAMIEIDLIRVIGKQQPIRIYAVLGDDAMAGDAAFQALASRHATLVAAYRGQDWAEARTLAAECRAAAPDLGALYDLYAERIAGFERDPPPAGWDGVFVAESK